MIDKAEINTLLQEWGNWQRSAKTPRMLFATSKMDIPVRKKRNSISPCFNQRAEKLDKLMVKYLPTDYILTLELTFVEKRVNSAAADILKCSQKTFTIKRGEAIAALQGAYSVARDYAA